MSDCDKCDDNPHPSSPVGSGCPTKPKIPCKPVDLCEYKKLENRYLLRKEEGDCPLIQVFGEDGPPCWYRLCVLDEGEEGPVEDGITVIYDCLKRPWKLQGSKDAAAIELAVEKACAAADAAAANAAAIAALAPDTNTTSAISGFTAGPNPGQYIVTLTESDGATSTATLTVPESTFDGTTITLSDGTAFTPRPDDDITAVIGSQVNAAGEATVTVEEGGTSFTGTITCVQPLISGCGVGGVVTPLVKGDEVLRATIDPINRCSQESGVGQFGLGTAKGRNFRLSVNLQHISAVGTGTDDAITASTPVGTVLAETNCRTVQIPDCGGRVQGFFTANWLVTEANANGGDALVVNEWTQDGGMTWGGMLSGGQDSISAINSINDKEHTELESSAVLPAGPADVCFREVLVGNDLAPDSVIGNATQQTGRIGFMEHRHCAV